MRFLGDSAGSIIFVNGGTAVKPRTRLAGTGVAFAGLSAYAEMLHEQLAEEGIHVAQLVIGGAIVEGDEEKDPERLADRLWDLT